MTHFSELLDAVDAVPARRLALAAAHERSVLESVVEAQAKGYIEGVLVGDVGKMKAIAEEAGLDLSPFELVDVPGDTEAAVRATDIVAAGDADILMKGYVHTDDLLRAVLRRHGGLRGGRLMSHVFVMEPPSHGRFFFVSDGAMNIAPTLHQKAQILLNAAFLALLLGIEEPKIACLSAVETVNPNIPGTVDADALARMWQSGAFKTRCAVCGPLALDNAVSEEAARTKRIGGPVAGRADVLLVPNIESGNMLFKSMVYFGGSRLAGIVLGATAPIVLTSRADSPESKLLSIALATYVAHEAARRGLEPEVAPEV